MSFMTFHDIFSHQHIILINTIPIQTSILPINHALHITLSTAIDRLYEKLVLLYVSDGDIKLPTRNGHPSTERTDNRPIHYLHSAVTILNNPTITLFNRNSTLTLINLVQNRKGTFCFVTFLIFLIQWRNGMFTQFRCFESAGSLDLTFCSSVHHDCVWSHQVLLTDKDTYQMKRIYPGS